MFTYIKKSVDGFYLELPDKLTSDLYNDLGESYEDFTNNKWVLLSDEQIDFRKENPTASVKEVFEMALTPVHVRDLQDAKREMLDNINRYDNGENVNQFTINGIVNAWFSPSERQGYKQSVDAAKLLGVEKLSFFANNQAFEVTTDKAEMMLASLQLYADACFLVTKKHQLAIEALKTIEEVDNYPYTEGYPTKLNFDLA